jgi:hypothetical protein
MCINKISFVGVDAKTDLRELENLASQSDVVLEFGILYSETKNSNRYPSQSVIDEFASVKRGDLDYDISLHLCGTSVQKFLDEDLDFMENMFKFNEFNAIQLNFSLKAEKDIPDIVEKALTATWSTGADLIFQANKSKQKLIDYLINKKIHENQDVRTRLLYDGSGGFGRTIAKIDKPFKDFYTGYAGGINPETISKIAHAIVNSFLHKSAVINPMFTHKVISKVNH